MYGQNHIKSVSYIVAVRAAVKQYEHWICYKTIAAMIPFVYGTTVILWIFCIALKNVKIHRVSSKGLDFFFVILTKFWFSPRIAITVCNVKLYSNLPNRSGDDTWGQRDRRRDMTKLICTFWRTLRNRPKWFCELFLFWICHAVKYTLYCKCFMRKVFKYYWAK